MTQKPMSEIRDEMAEKHSIEENAHFSEDVRPAYIECHREGFKAGFDARDRLAETRALGDKEYDLELLGTLETQVTVLKIELESARREVEETNALLEVARAEKNLAEKQLAASQCEFERASRERMEAEYKLEEERARAQKLLEALNQVGDNIGDSQRRDVPIIRAIVTDALKEYEQKGAGE